MAKYDPFMPPRQTGSEQTAQALLDAMVGEIRRVGIKNARVSIVLSDVNVSPSSLYHHWGSKEELVVAAQLQIAREDLSNEDIAIRLVA